MDHALADHGDDEELREARLEKGDIFRLLDRGAVKRKLIPSMLNKAQALAAEKMKTLVADAAAAMNTQLAAEIERLETLRTINDHVRPEEIATLQQQKNELQSAIESARLRLDSLRLVLRLPAGK